MASIEWSIVGLQFSEAQREAAATAGDIEAQRLLAIQAALRRQALITDPLAGGSAGTAQSIMDLPGITPLITATPGDTGARSPAQLLADGFIYHNGIWMRPGDPRATQDAIPSAAVVSSSSVLLPSSGGPRPTNAALADPFIGGGTDRVRLTTGIGAGQDGPLTPVREGIAGITRIIIDDVYT